MPILDPSSQYQLLNEINSLDKQNAIRFYMRYLRIASQNIYRNFSTFDTSLQFKKDLSESLPLIFQIFEFELPEDDFDKPIITDFYKYLYDKINKKPIFKKEKSNSVDGRYFSLYDNYETRYFQPNLFFNSQYSDTTRSWFLTDTNIAILAIQLIDDISFFNQLIKLEIDLMAAAGFILVLTAQFTDRNMQFLLKLISENQFSEIHLNIQENDQSESFLKEIIQHNNTHLMPFKGFFYLYSHFIDKEKIDLKNAIKELKKNPRFTLVKFAKSIFDSIRKPIFSEIRPFPYYKNGFYRKNLRIFLSNVPLYDRSDNPNDLIPVETSGLALCYLSTGNFLKWKNKMVEVLVDEKTSHFKKRYVIFDDLHYLNKDLFVKDMLSLGSIDPDTLDKIDLIEKKIKHNLRHSSKFQRKLIISLIKENRINDYIEYVTRGYSYFSNSLNIDFSVHRTQIYTALMACKKLLSKKNINMQKLYDEKREIENILSLNSNKYSNSINSNIANYTDKLYVLGTKFLNRMPQEKKELLNRFLLTKPNNYMEQYLGVAEEGEQNALTDFLSMTEESQDEKLKKKKEDLEKKIEELRGKCHRGFVYQVETGEGKSCIIAMIAAILALNGVKVHIASSNIKLANRDYMNSFEFFKLFKLKSAVLVHENELPIPRRKKKANEEKTTKKKVNFKNIFSKKPPTNQEDTKKQENAKESDKKETSTKSDTKKPELEKVFDKKETTTESDTKIDGEKETKGKDDNTETTSENATEDNQNEEEEDHDFFKDNSKNYYEYHTKEKAEFEKYYNFEYYDPEQFRNSSRMNFSVCGLDSNNNINFMGPKIIYSTFVNFECFYLKMMELCPGYISNYYSKCALLIDEADSILIDEIANGTIVSKEIKSNTKEILQYVYDHKDGMDVSEMYKYITDKWKKCNKRDITLKDVERMYSEIDLVNKDDSFTKGKKYLINEIHVKNDKKKKRLIGEVLNLATDIFTDIGKGLIKELSRKEDADGEEDEDEDDDDDDDDEEDDNEEAEEDEEEDDDDENSPYTTFREIIPFDFDHKGILEPNKEFGGFIQQFIAIKESKVEENKNMLIKDMSMSYLYVSHPNFVKLYSSVCGFTGTIGDSKDKKIYSEQYDLETLRVPRNSPNYRVEFPMMLCETDEERKMKIINEVLVFHRRGNPVLVIFQDLSEIDTFSYELNLRGIKYINIFDGKNDAITPDYIAGKRGAVSLGTNVCGRGTNIIAKNEPLHVIITYYTTNSRVMDQARGRTARQGRKGTCRIICKINEYLYPTIVDGSGIKATIGEFEVKNKIQSVFINFFTQKKPWIFSRDMKKQELSHYQIKEMREARVNVNRIVAYNFEFPFIMSVETFLNIQAQRIFSLLNCPNCEFSWRLFQNYVREMVLESWSLKQNETDVEFFDREENKEFKKEMKELNDLHLSVYSDEYKQKLNEINIKYESNIFKYAKILEKNMMNLIDQLEVFLPNNISDIVESFMFIFNKVRNEYESKILDSFESMQNAYFQYDQGGFIAFQTGFRPYSLLTESGARISSKNFHKTNYIKDPELSYIKKMPNNKICWLSITEKIDDIFNKILQKINEVIGKYTCLRLFMRRTLCGCEFGVCLDLAAKNKGFDDPNCLFDKDPLLMFTISVRSMLPILAGILMILLVYASSMSEEIMKWISGFPAMFTKELGKRVAAIIVSTTAPELVHFGLDKVIKFLKKTLNKQLKKLKKAHCTLAETSVKVIECLLYIFSSKAFSKAQEKVTEILGEKIKLTLDLHKLLYNCFDPERIIKISLLFMLCMATFILNFHTQKDRIKNAKSAFESERDDANQIEKSYDRKIGDKNFEEKNDKKYEDAVNNITEKNKKHLDKKELKDDFDEKAFSDDDDDDEDWDKGTPKEKKELEEKYIEKMNAEERKIEAKNDYLLEFVKTNPLEAVKKVTNYIDDKIEKFEKIQKWSNGVAELKEVFGDRNKMKKFIRMRYRGFRKPFIQQLTIYATNTFPSILKVIGRNISKKRQDLIVEYKENGSLESFLKKSNRSSMSPTDKLIIAYGVARAMEFLHSHKIVHRNLKPVNIMLDKKLHPFLSEFYYAKQTQTNLPYCLQEMTAEFMPPEFFSDYKSNQNSFKVDVYSFGVTLFILLNEMNPYADMSLADIITGIQSGLRPVFAESVGKNWRDLINRCWNQDPKKRPSFSEIRNILESKSFLNRSIAHKTFNAYKNHFNKYDSK